MIRLTSAASNATPGTLTSEALTACRDWARRFGADTPRHLRYASLAPWVHPDLLPERQTLLSNIYVFYRVYDDFNDAYDTDFATSRALANAMIGILDDRDPTSGATAVRMFHDLWRQHRESAPATFLTRTAAHWRGYFATQTHYLAMRKPDFPWNLEDYLALRLDNGGLHLSISQGELANARYIPTHVYRLSALTAMRRMASYCVILTNDLYSAMRDAKNDDHRNPVAQHMKHARVSRQEAEEFVRRLLFDYTDRLHRHVAHLEHECDLLELDPEDRALARIGAQNCINHAAGYEAWAARNEAVMDTLEVRPDVAPRAV
ncbi:terpene synthase family protein [Nonomuraea sp. NPDC050404]|uniref:terpene synthase family protein n=1 Tax=Nonomuraea sp. NPDC050404 TaxID=3155783 RepID=UPI0033DAACFF